MPEGDTLWRTARTLAPCLVGRRMVQAAVSPRWRDVAAASLVSRQVQAVESRGKHLLIHFDDQRHLHCHLGMTGSWHIYRVAEAWHKPARHAALVLHTDGEQLAVCFSPQQLELLTATRLRRHPWLQRLGPDILAEPLPLDEILPRLCGRPDLPLGEALLRQEIVAGVGNVYKSEALFLERINPFQRVGGTPIDRLRDLMLRTSQLMRKNLQGFPRRTRRAGDGSRVWVYGRSGQPCLHCGTQLRMRRQGQLGRSTYYCPQCQGVRLDGGGGEGDGEGRAIRD